MRSIGAASQQTSIAYDRTDNPVTVSDPRSNLYSFAYDGLGRVMRETDQEGSQVNLTRDGQDGVTAYADPRALVTSYVRNGFGEVIRETSPDAGVTATVRDQRGLATQVTDGRGVVVNMAYDTGGRLLSETYPASPTENVSYAYDSVAGGNKGVGRLTGVTDQSGSTALAYDALGRIASETRVIGARSYTTSYAYDAADHVSQITYPSGRIRIARFSFHQRSGNSLLRHEPHRHQRQCGSFQLNLPGLFPRPTVSTTSFPSRPPFPEAEWTHSLPGSFWMPITP